MARLKCANCGHRVGANDVICRNCGAPLLEDGAVVEDVVEPPFQPETQPVQADSTEPSLLEVQLPAIQPSASGASSCPHCGAPVPDPDNLVCLECLQELHPAPDRPGPVTTPAAGRDPHATTVERPQPRLWVRFSQLTVELTAGQEAALGRDRFAGSARMPADFDNVSRRHATVGLRPDGSAWVRDEGSTNGTFVDGRPAPAGVAVPLANGAELRLASNVRATIGLEAPRSV